MKRSGPQRAAFPHSWSRAACVAALLLLAGCHTLFGDDTKDEAEKKELSGERIAILQTVKKIEVAPDAQKFPVELPEMRQNEDWSQTGGNTEHDMGHLALSSNPEKIWSTSIGDGSESYFKLLAQPVVNGNRIFTIDAQGEVRAFSADKGERLWRFDTTPENANGEAMGAGLAVDGPTLFVTTGFGETLALQTANGKPIWRKTIGKPFRSAPTASNGRVFVVTIDNETHALSAADGAELWTHNGIAENATLMGGSSPAVDGDNVVVAYSSGEVFNLRAQNGRVAWTDVLAVPEKVGALPAIADIRGLPVIDHGGVFALSHSDRLAAIDMRSGERAWDADIGGITTPLVAGNAVFAISNDNELVAMARRDGRVLWVTELQKLKTPSDRDSGPVFWFGPLLAGGRLWLTNSLGHLVAFAPDDGAKLVDDDMGGAFYLPPVVAENTMYLLRDDGRLLALQ